MESVVVPFVAAESKLVRTWTTPAKQSRCTDPERGCHKRCRHYTPSTATLRVKRRERARIDCYRDFMERTTSMTRPTRRVSIALILAISSVVLISIGASGASHQAAQRVPLRLVKWQSFTEPMDLVSRPNHDDTVWVAERAGKIFEVNVESGKKQLALDLRKKVVTDGEYGLLGLAWDADGANLYVHYSKAPDGNTQVSAFPIQATGTFGSEQSILRVTQPAQNHNGGSITFDGNGNLLIGLGDGGGADDNGYGHVKFGNAQSKSTLLGKILRITPTPGERRPYRIPADNPFASTAGKDEIFVMGLRNPFRFSVDLEEETLWIGDVGQGEWEEINRVALRDAPGMNFGWPRREGNHHFSDGPKKQFAAPFVEVSHEDGACAVIGGRVMHDPRIPTWEGMYLFSDFCTGTMSALDSTSRTPRTIDMKLTIDAPSAFGEDAQGRLYVLSNEGKIFRIDPK